MAEQFRDQEYLEYVTKGIVGHPEDVRVERTVDEMGVLLTLHINQADMGYVIGRQGQTARAIRTLLKIVGAKNNARVNMKIYEPENLRLARRAQQEAPSVQPAQPADDAGSIPAMPDTSMVDDLKI